MNAVPPGLSDSYSFQATGVTLVNTSVGVTTLNYVRYNYAEDNTQFLSVMDSTYVSDGAINQEFLLASGNDDITYSDTNGVCTTSQYASTSLLSGTSELVNFVTGVEAPPGTVTYNLTYQGDSVILVTVNGLPVSYMSTYIFDTYNVTMILNIHSYTNSTPPFSTFVIPEACLCDSCYSPSATTMSPTTTPSSAVSVTSSFLLMLAALAMFLFSTV